MKSLTGINGTASPESALIVEWYRAALDAVDPATAIRAHLTRRGADLFLDGTPLPVTGRLFVVSVGKAAVGMARGAVDVCGERIQAGIVITKDGHADVPLPPVFVVFEAAHPVPDERGVRATRAALDLLATARQGDLVLALISGGGSALLEAPRPPLTLAELAATTDLLLRAGAPIQDLNAVRTLLSLVKGGGLRRAAGAATVVTLILSDVLGNDLHVIASGPTVPTAFSPANAVLVLDRFGVRDQVPRSVVDLLSTQGAKVDDWLSAAKEDRVVVVGDNTMSVREMADVARTSGRTVHVIWREQQGEAAELGRAWVAACEAADEGIDVLLGGGEATVTVRGDGVGGRNTEFALAAALALADRGLRAWTIASLATDGQDALTGVAGAVADAGTVTRARAAGVDPVEALHRNDSLRVFQAAGGLVTPGPTGTNVNDLYVAVRRRAIAAV